MTTAGAARRLATFAAEFASRFPERIDGPPTVGREAEFPIVDAEGRAGDSTRLWPLLVERSGGRPYLDVGRDGRPLLAGVETQRWFCTAEVGLGTIEIGVGPRRSVVELEMDLTEALACVVPAGADLGYRVLGFGIQPRTPPSMRLLTPKRRYLTLADAVGAGWIRWTVTASDQVHVAMPRDRLVPAMNAINAVSGAIIALCADSSIYGGRAAAASGREALSARVTGEPFRNGAVRHAYADVEDYVRESARFRTLFLGDPKIGFTRYDEPFDRLLDRFDLTFEDFLLHEHYLWPSARPRARLGTLEIRPACQQPDGSFAAAALSLGLTTAADDVLQIAGASWTELLRYRREAVHRGIGAHEPRPGFLLDLLGTAERGLRQRGLGEERYLEEIGERLERRRGPADEARSDLAHGGILALVERRALS